MEVRALGFGFVVVIQAEGEEVFSPVARGELTRAPVEGAISEADEVN